MNNVNIIALLYFANNSEYFACECPLNGNGVVQSENTACLSKH